MPIYEYQCSACNKEFETLVFKTDEKVSCPKCKGTEVRRLMSSCSFKSEGNYSSSASSSSCSGCAATSCSTCH